MDLKDKEINLKIKDFIHKHIEYINDTKQKNNLIIDDKNLKIMHNSYE